MTFLLHQFLEYSARAYPDKKAVVSGKSCLTYHELNLLTNQLANILREKGVTRGDRVGIYVSKSLASVICMFAILKAGGCYVPLDPQAPEARLAFIIQDSGIRALLTSSEKVGNIRKMFPEDSPLRTAVLVDCDVRIETSIMDLPELRGIEVVSWKNVLEASSHSPENDLTVETDTAYILYTSGSTGTPKGVMISHRNSLTFVNWAAECVSLTSEDRVSSHAPLHFDLSTFDIFSSCKAGATVIIIPEGISTFPVQLTQLIEKERISVWYSAPSALTLLVLYGNLSSHDLTSLRTIVFAGEVFPTKYLRKLMTALPRARYFNWYGPTETNVCTYYEVTHLDPEQTVPIPIGKPCANTDTFIVDDEGRKVTIPGESGELYVRGPSLMQGYWRLADKTAKVLVPNPFQTNFHELVYKTGDIVTLDKDGNYLFLGRRDGMIKTRGYRVELGEVESVIYGHPGIKEVAVLPVPDEILGNRLRAVISLQEGFSLTRDDIAGFCSERLPKYMVPDLIEFRDVLPKTSTGKTDRVSLAKSYVSKRV
jgi:amino acid adenylation domain-containing protein